MQVRSLELLIGGNDSFCHMLMQQFVMGTIYPRELNLPLVVLKWGQGRKALQLRSAICPVNGEGSSNKMQSQIQKPLA